MPSAPTTSSPAARPAEARSSGSRALRARLVADAEHCELVTRVVRSAKVSLWIGTANVKELRVEADVGTRARARGRYVSILELVASAVERGVEVRLLHAGVPSRAFRAELARQPSLASGRFAMRQCPRVHFKVLASDGSLLYVGSANLTGAGLGAKREGRRNFELGFVTDDELTLDAVQERFDRIWRGAECGACKLRGECPRPLDGAPGAPPRRPAAKNFTRGGSAGSLGRGGEATGPHAPRSDERPARPRRRRIP